MEEERKSESRIIGYSMTVSDSFGGLVVSMMASGTQVCGFKEAEAVGFLRA